MATTASVVSDFMGSYQIHDVWTEAFVGVRHLIYDLLPSPGRRLSIESLALCQLGLVGANHLVEVGLYRFLESRPAFASLSSSRKTALRSSKYVDMLKLWVPELAGWTPDLTAPPFQCTERLRRRRNDTVHKTSAKANVPMCRSAIFSAVRGMTELWTIAGEPFPYSAFLEKYPLPLERPFSEVTFAR
jgi:hypothetical protein